MPLLIAALLGLTAALIVAFPLLGLTRGQTEVSAPSALGEVADRERQARQALREVELDYTLGNLDSGDYDTLRGRYERRALAALRTRYQREQELDALIERQLDSLRAAKPASERAAPVVSKPADARPAPVRRAPHAATPRDRRARNKKGSQ